MSTPLAAHLATNEAPRPTGLEALAPNASALLAVIGCMITLAVIKAIGSVVGAPAALYLAGGMAILAIPAAVAWTKHTLRATGAEGWPAFAFYLSMYHSPLMRLVFGGQPLDGTEVDVLEIALYASALVSCVVSLRPGAFEPRRALPPPLEDYTVHGARTAAYAGIGATLIGYTLLSIWISSMGLDRIASASLGDVYLYAGAQGSIVTFQWPFIIGGVLTMAIAFARWPGRGPGFALRALFYLFVVAFALVNARLGARGPTLELCGAIYMVRHETRRPVPSRLVLIFAPLFAVFFFFVSAMRSHLDSGITGTSLDEVTFQAETSVDAENTSEFDAVFKNSTMIVRFAGTQIPFLNGESWSDMPLQLVPRQIVGSKPLGLSNWWIQYIDPEAAAQGGGRAFGSFAEGYLNFGAPGAVVQVGAVTVFLLALIPLLRARRVGIASAGAATLAHGYHCHRSEMLVAAFTFRNALLVGLATLLIWWVIAQLRPAKGGIAPT